MSRTRPEIRHYLEAVCPGAQVRPLAGDASTRLFFRIRPAAGATRILMDYGRPFREETDDVRLARIFRNAGLRVAEIVDVSGRAGCLLMEDLGDRTLESALTDSETEEARRHLMERAVELAARVAVRGTAELDRSERKDGPALDADRFRFEMDFFLEHYARGLRGCGPLPPTLRTALHGLAAAAAGTPRRVLCHRDFHGRNLLVLGDGSLAMVDIQDARWGPDSYDLASLLRDAYVDVEEAWIDPLIALYRSLLAEPPEEAEFRRRFDRVAAQRMIKALGTFGRLGSSPDGRRYLDAVPRTLERLRRLLPESEETRELHGLLTEAGLLDDPDY